MAAVARRDLAYFNDIITRNPRDEVPYFHRGEIYRAKDDDDRAIADFSEALRLDPSYREAFVARGSVYLSKGAYDDAIADFSAAIGLGPGDRLAYFRRSRAYFAKNDWDRVIADCGEFLRITPDNVESLVDLRREALRLRGDAYLNKGDDDRALEDYDKVQPYFVDAAINRGIIFLHKRDWDRAIAASNRAMIMVLGRKLPRALSVRGQAFVGRGEYGSAIQDFDEAIRLAPKFAAAFIARADAYEKTGDRDRAIADYRQALAIDPDKMKNTVEPALARLGATP